MDRPALPTPARGLGAHRQLAGTAVLVVGLPVLTAVLVRMREQLSFATPVLLVLTVVVAVGGRRVALPGAVAGGLALNWFFTSPYGTLVVDQQEQLVVLVVYLGIAVLVSTGTGVVAGLRGWCAAPILVLSARSGQADEVAALDSGADDKVVKPFGMDELLARLRAAVRRRATGGSGKAVVRPAAASVDLAGRSVTRDGAAARLTPTEWHLLEGLARNAGRLVSQRELLREVWGPAYEDESQYLRVYLAALRRKLEPVPARPVHLLTEPDVGYRLQP